jgi:4-hydroxybenzoate polyprenyltransferase
MRETILMPILQKYGFSIPDYSLSAILLNLATVFIAAGGYVINDYFDVKIDAINRPEQQIVNRVVSKRTAMLLHQALTAIGIVAGLAAAHLSHSYSLAFVFIIVPGLLWFYSASYKRQFLIGNLIVSFLAALTVLIVAMNELALLQKEYGNLLFQTAIPTEFYGWVGGFALFSFLLTLIREIIKDMQDIKGDMEMECRTLAIKWGIVKTKIIVYTLIIISIATLLFLNFRFIHFEGALTLKFIAFGICIPLLALAAILMGATKTDDYKQAATLAKVIMLIGVSYGLIFYFLMAKTYNISLFEMFILNR